MPCRKNVVCLEIEKRVITPQNIRAITAVSK
jgi:hypothetical protein